MTSLEIRQDNCRVCLEQPTILNWNTELFELCGTTYRDCYYKYTQIEEIDDCFSPLLCKKCSADLKATHFLIEKALESHKILQKIFAESCDTSFIIKVENEIDTKEKDTAEFETLFFEQSKESDDNDKPIPMEMSPRKTPNMKSQACKRLKVQQIRPIENSTRKTPKTKSQVCKISKVQQIKLKTNNDSSEVSIDIPQSSKILTPLSVEDKVKDSCKNYKSKCSYLVCQYCSKLIKAYHIHEHEKIHQEERERNTTCSICDLKFYHKGALYSHMLTHEKNREKKNKCEFCEKAYFNRGALNVHRRIHLGQMITCTLCPKQFYRQVDLDKHMPSHSATPLHAGAEVTKPKYFVKCKECGKSIRSTRFKQHQAMHLNKPIMKCNICVKDFFSKSSCSKHMRQVHKDIQKALRNEFTTYYEENKGRLSHFMIKQTEIIERIAE